MSEKKIDTSFLDKAIKYAVDKHSGVERRGKGFPYIVHPMEAMEIVATITPDQELLAAAALHDVVEDTDTPIEDIEKNFGKRVASLVVAESDEKIEGMSEVESWHIRKQQAIDRLKNASYDGKIEAIGDKLSN
ncbi:MAG: HD domain-containing protein, partial [Lachnospiraceae bacterium]|nr:HD domain-containing protein [Lachnospiraceae bacterium]